MMFDRLMVLVNKTRALRSQEWGDDKVTRKMLRAYQAKNSILAVMIFDRVDFESLTPQALLSKLIHHENNQQDVINANSQNPNSTGYKKGVALSASNASNDNHSSKSKNKKDKSVVESSSDEDDGDDEVALLIKSFKKFIKKSYKKSYGDDKKRSKKIPYYECRELGHFVADCPIKTQED